MKSFKRSIEVLAWLCICPSDSARPSIRAKNILFALIFQAAGLNGVIYTSVAAFVLRPDTNRMFAAFQTFCDSSENLFFSYIISISFISS